MNADNKQSNNNVNSKDYDNTLPGYGVSNTNSITPMQKEQQQVQQQIESSHGKGYPGAIGATPAESKGVQGYDAQGNPIIPQFIAQRHQIEQSLGPTCKDGGYHDLRMHLTNSSLLFAVLIIPYCCGYRGKRYTVCKKCNQKFPQIVLPSA
jgi:MATE family multidrug resistance protein